MRTLNFPVVVATVLLAACSRPPRDAVWSVSSSEAFDAVVLVNATSEDQLYSRHYPGLRAEWNGRLGPEGMAAATRLFKDVSMSGVVRLLQTCGPQSLDDLITAFSSFNATAAHIEHALEAKGGANEFERHDMHGLSQHHQQLLTYFRALKSAGFPNHWKTVCKPSLDRQIASLHEALEDLHNSAETELLSRFLGAPRTPTRGIILLYYASPIAFTLNGGIMASEASQIPNIPIMGSLIARTQARHFAQVSLHESLHNFPGSAAVLKAQDALFAINPNLAGEHAVLRSRWHEGPEEYAVVAAEAYLSQATGLRSRSETEPYVRTQNGGMTLAMIIFGLLQAQKPDQAPGWNGYGPWLAVQLQSGVINGSVSSH